MGITVKVSKGSEKQKIKIMKQLSKYKVLSCLP